MDDKNLLNAATTLLDYELCRIPSEDLRKMTKEKLARMLAEEILNSKKVQWTEMFDGNSHFHMGKTVIASIVTLSREEYHELLKAQKDLKELKRILNK